MSSVGWGPGSEASFILQHMAAVLLSSSHRDGHSSPGSMSPGTFLQPQSALFHRGLRNPRVEGGDFQRWPTLSCLPLLIDLEDRGYVQVPFLPTFTGPLLALAQHTSRLDALSWAWWGP